MYIPTYEEKRVKTQTGNKKTQKERNKEGKTNVTERRKKPTTRREDENVPEIPTSLLSAAKSEEGREYPDIVSARGVSTRSTG